MSKIQGGIINSELLFYFSKFNEIAIVDEKHLYEMFRGITVYCPIWKGGGMEFERLNEAIFLGEL